MENAGDLDGRAVNTLGNDVLDAGFLALNGAEVQGRIVVKECDGYEDFRKRGGIADVFGPKAGMEGISGDRKWSGDIYGQSCGGYFYLLWLKEHAAARAALKPLDRNRITVEAKGRLVKTWEVLFRSIRVKEPGK